MNMHGEDIHFGGRLRTEAFERVNKHDRSAFAQRIVGALVATTNIKITIQADHQQ
jgi:hypothetical protein